MLASRKMSAEQNSVDIATELALKRLEEGNFDSLNERDKTLSTIWGLEAEVNNGGFDQFFFNSAGDLAFYAPTALRAIGAHRMAALAEEANSVFGPSGPPRHWEARQAQVIQFSQETKTHLDRLDRLFYEYPDNIGALLKVYVAEHSG